MKENKKNVLTFVLKCISYVVSALLGALGGNVI